MFDILHRGYYTAAQRYEFYFRVVRTIFYERAQRVSKILFLTRENKIHIFKPPCNFLFIIWTINNVMGIEKLDLIQILGILQTVSLIQNTKYSVPKV